MSALLIEHRGRLVAKYRVNPQVWPDGIDSPGDRWYTGHEHEWGPTDAKGIARPVDKPVDTSSLSTGSVDTVDRKEYQRRWLAAKRAAQHE